VSTADVIEAASKVDGLAVQAWIAERRQRFDLDATTLVTLDDAGVPGAVTDVMVAVTYPQQFRFEQRVTEPEPSSHAVLAPRPDGYNYAHGHGYPRG
jgi:hypothetical protein